MECVGEYQHQPQESLKTFAEHWHYQSPRLQNGGVSRAAVCILRTVIAILWLFRTLPDAPFSYTINTGCKDSGILSHSKMFCYLFKDSYFFSHLKGQTSCYFMRIIYFFHPYTPFLSPSPVRGMFRFGDMVSDVSFQYYNARASSAVMIVFLFSVLCFISCNRAVSV